MAGEKSELAKILDELQGKLWSILKEHAFRSRGRTFNRMTSDGLIDVVNLQMGSFDPPGTTYFPGLRENLYGKFTVNLGVYVSEVAQHQGGSSKNSFVREHDCCVRARLGQLGPEPSNVWWNIRRDEVIARQIQQRLERDALPFFKRFETRDAILAELQSVTEAPFIGTPPRIVCAIILAERGQASAARELLVAQAKETRNPGHPAHVRALAEKLGLGNLGT